MMLNDVTNSYRVFNVDSVNSVISALDHVRRLRFSSIVHLTSINKLFNLVTLE